MSNKKHRANLPDRLRDGGPTFRFSGTDWPMGPAMRALGSDRMRAFVVAYTNLVNPSRHGAIKQAAMLAGYENAPEHLSHQGHSLLQREDVLEAIREMDIKRLGVIGSKAVKALEAQVDNPVSKHHAKAVEMALERYVPTSKYIHHTVEKVQSPEDEALQLYRDLKAAGTSQEVLEHTFGAIGVARYERMIGGDNDQRSSDRIAERMRDAEKPKPAKSKKRPDVVDVEAVEVVDPENPDDW